MSYCRFSCDDYRSDVYVYNDVGGYYQVYVAANRVVPKEPLPPVIHWEKGNTEAYLARHEKVSRIIGDSKHEDIGLPLDGESYQLPDLESLLEKLEEIKGHGYHVPDHAFESIRAQMKKEACNPDESGE